MTEQIKIDINQFYTLTFSIKMLDVKNLDTPCMEISDFKVYNNTDNLIYSYEKVNSKKRTETPL